MKIGILTYHWVQNFGANLQSYAVKEILKEKGHNPIFINFVHEDLKKMYQNRIPEVQYAAHEDFVKDELVLTKECHNEKDLIEICKKEQVESIIVGSDAVLMINFRRGLSDTIYPNPFWLNWKNNDLILKKIPSAFLSASSMGSYYFRLDSNTRKQMTNSLEQFNYISVRDKWTRWMLKYVLRIKNGIINTPDPVSYFPRLKNLKNLDLSSPRSKKYILVSTKSKKITQDWVDELVLLANREGMEVGELPMPEGYSGLNFDFNVEVPLSPLEWYRYIANSEGYFGERFHAVVVSLYNKIPFVVIDTYASRKLQKIGFEYPSKIYDLCKRGRLLKNRITNSDIHKIQPNQVFTLLKEFDKEKCGKFVEKEQNKFNENIDDLLITLQSK